MTRGRSKEPPVAVAAQASAWRLWPCVLTVLYHLLRLSLAMVFIYAGLVKLWNPQVFAHALAQFQLLPDSLLPLVAIGLPAVELLAGLGLLADLRLSLIIIQVMLGVFILILGYAVLRDLDIDCGCFTFDELTARTSVKVAFFRDLLMVAAVFFLFWWRRCKTQGHLRTIGKFRLIQRKER